MTVPRATPTPPPPASPAERTVFRFVWRTLDKFFGDGCPSMAAALAFYTFFSLPALLTLLLTLVGLIADPRAVQAAITGQIERLIGHAGAEQVATIIQHGRRTEVDPTITALLSLVALMLGATTAFGQLQAALNRAWGVKPDPRLGQFRNFIVKRIFSFGVVLAVAFLLLVSLAMSAALGALGTRLTAGWGMPESAVAVLDWVVSFAVVSVLFAAMYKLLPDARIAWRDVWVGAVVTALLFTLGKLGIGFYLGDSDPGTAYGAAGSLAVVLIWVYYTSILVLYGAEFTRIWAEWYGGGVRPEKGAVEFVEEERRLQTG